jgi:UDP-2,3-diacylglucosamine pyrophosphatase LpxH
MSAMSDALTRVHTSAKTLPLDDTSRYILFSDCHRGDNGWADDFAPNQMLLFHALTYYLANGFTYIEVGDGDELWENLSFETIRGAHSHIYWLMSKFYENNRLYLMWGNHNYIWRDRANVEKHLYHYIDERTGVETPLFPGIEVHEGIILKGADPKHSLFLVHGHQGDPINDQYAAFGRFFVHYFWRNMQLLGIHDPTSAAQNFRKRIKVEQEIVDWAVTNQQIVIAGHTHRPAFPQPGDLPYFNTGSCVHPRCITGIEIKDGMIALVKWSVWPDENGSLHIVREELEPAGPLSAYFEAGQG